MKKRTPHQEITDRIITALETGTAPWRKPWSAGVGGMPRNLLSNKSYRGINIWLLGSMPYGSPYWVTYKQAKTLKGHVRKGEKGTRIVFWKFLDKTDSDGKDYKLPMIRFYTVFNVEQCEGLESKHLETPDTFEHDPIAAAEAILDGYRFAPKVVHAGSRAFYRPSQDLVQLPERDRFETPADYYSTLFHELGHSTGHANRINRPGVAETVHFGTHTYGLEELVAEMTAAFLCGTSGIEGTLENSAAYLAGWIKVLKGDPRLALSAASKAQKAADLILDTAPAR